MASVGLTSGSAVDVSTRRDGQEVFYTTLLAGTVLDATPRMKSSTHVPSSRPSFIITPSSYRGNRAYSNSPSRCPPICLHNRYAGCSVFTESNDRVLNGLLIPSRPGAKNAANTRKHWHVAESICPSLVRGRLSLFGGTPRRCSADMLGGTIERNLCTRIFE